MCHKFMFSIILVVHFVCYWWTTVSIQTLHQIYIWTLLPAIPFTFWTVNWKCLKTEPVSSRRAVIPALCHVRSLCEQRLASQHTYCSVDESFHTCFILRPCCIAELLISSLGSPEILSQLLVSCSFTFTVQNMQVILKKKKRRKKKKQYLNIKLLLLCAHQSQHNHLSAMQDSPVRPQLSAFMYVETNCLLLLDTWVTQHKKFGDQLWFYSCFFFFVYAAVDGYCKSV